MHQYHHHHHHHHHCHLPEVAAAKGWKQYYYSKELVQKASGTKQSNGVEAHTDLKEEEYAEVQKHIEMASGAPIAGSAKATKRKPMPQREPDNPDKKRRRESVANRSSMARKLKALVDKAKNEIEDLRKLVPNLTSKGYPAEMQAWCTKQLDDMADLISPAHKIYLEEAARTITDDIETDHITSMVSTIDSATCKLDKDFATWKKDKGTELRKIIT